MSNVAVLGSGFPDGSNLPPSDGVVERRFVFVDFDPSTASVAVLGLVVPNVVAGALANVTAAKVSVQAAVAAVLGIDGALVRVDYCAFDPSGRVIADLTVSPAGLGTASARVDVVSALDVLLNPFNVNNGGYELVATGRVDVMAMSDQANAQRCA